MFDRQKGKVSKFDQNAQPYECDSGKIVRSRGDRLNYPRLFRVIAKPPSEKPSTFLRKDSQKPTYGFWESIPYPISRSHDL